MLQIGFSDDSITVWGWSGSGVTLHKDGQ